MRVASARPPSRVLRPVAELERLGAQQMVEKYHLEMCRDVLAVNPDAKPETIPHML